MKKVIALTMITYLVINLFSNAMVTKANQDCLSVTVDFNDYKISASNDYSVIYPEKHFTFDSKTGEPQIPFRIFFVRVGRDGDIDVNFEILRDKTVNLERKIRPEPLILSEDNRFIYRPDTQSYDNYYQKLVEKGDIFHSKNNYFIPLKIYPFQYDGNKKLRIIEKLKLNINIDQPFAERDVKIFLDDGIEYVATSERQKESDVNFADFSKSDHWFKIEVSADGMHRLNYDDLTALPLADLDPTTIRLFSTGGAAIAPLVSSNGNEFKEIAIEIIGENDGSFDENDAIIFYGRNRDGFEMNPDNNDPYYYNRFSGNSVYWLTFAADFDTAPKRISTATPPDNFDGMINSHITEIYYGQDSIKRFDYAYWWFDRVIPGIGQQLSFNFEANSPVENSASSITFAMQEDDDFATITHNHDFAIYLNDAIQDNISWTNRTYAIRTIDAATPLEGQNSLKLQSLSDYTVFFDYYKLNYEQYLDYRDEQFTFSANTVLPDLNGKFIFQNQYNDDYQIYKIDNFADVQAIMPENNDGYLSFKSFYEDDDKFIVMRNQDYLSVNSVTAAFPEDLADVGQSPVDYIIISADKFLSDAEEIVQMHQEYNNLNGKIVSQQNIFNQFSGGMPDPEAIRLYLKYYTEEISSDLQSAILLGSGTNDWRNFSGNADYKNNVIFYQKDVSYDDSCDDYFVYFDHSSFPQLSIGRYPAINSSELNTMINKTREYLQNPTPGYWKNKVLIVGDDNYHGTSSNELSHSSQTQDQGEELADFMYADKLFAIEYELDGFQNKPEASDEIVRRINDGRLVFYYIGHGSYKKLGDEEYFDSLSDIPALTNRDKLHLFIAASCDVAMEDLHLYDSLAKKMFSAENGGAFASLAATRKCSGPANTSLMSYFLDEAFSDKAIGQALVDAKETHYSTANSARYLILGDPLVKMNYPRPTGNISFAEENEDIQARQTVNISGDFTENISGEMLFKVYDSEADRTFTYPTSDSTYSYFNYTVSSNKIFNGELSLDNGLFDGSFIVPDDIAGGDDGKMVSYFYDDITMRDYNCYYSPITFAGHDYPAENDGPPQIEIYLDYETFQNGDVVSKAPLLVAKLSDANGLNTLAEPGHRMTLLIDDELTAIDVTSGFEYDLDSHTSGVLAWQLNELEAGNHELILNVFDNFNMAAYRRVEFITKDETKLSINDLMTYPSPYKGARDFFFTFILTQDADIDISIHTITGKKIQTIKEYNQAAGFVKIPWNVRDRDGDEIANGTYFYKIKAKDINSGDTSVKTEKLIIYQ